MGKIFASFQNHHRDYSIIKNLYFIFITEKLGCPLVTQLIKNLPAMGETWVPSLGWEDLLEKGQATHSSILAWRISIDRGTCWTIVCGVAKSRTRLND